MQTFVKIKTNFTGIHCWANCPYDEVAFLRSEHRHIFYVTVQVEVGHDDRDIEFFILKKEVNQIIEKLYGPIPVKNLGSKSCEMINKEIYQMLEFKYPKRKMIIETSEDNENSAVTHFAIEEAKWDL